MSGDDELRGRLSALADEGAPHLDEVARERVLDRVQQEGPAHVARARWGRIAGIGGALAAAAAVVFFIATTDRPRAPVAPAPDAPACERWGAAIATPRDGLLRLGRRGEATFDGELSMSAPDSCTTELELAVGRVTVRVDDLGEGTLRVLAGEVVVEVRGTRFTVVRGEAHVAVDVEEGHVLVRAPGEREIHLHAGERWSRGSRTASAELGTGAPNVDEPNLGEPNLGERSVEAPPTDAVEPNGEPDLRHRVVRQRGHREEPAALSEAERLREAERLWRAGESGRARAIFRDVGGGRGSTAEAAWLRLARLEVATGELVSARTVLATQRRRFPRSRLGPEVLWLQADVARRLGDTAGRSRALAELRERYPDSPQARSASNLEGAADP